MNNLRWELFGVAMAYNCTFAVMFLSLLFFSYSNNEIRLTHVKPNFNLFEDLPSHFLQGLPNLAIVCLETWVWELMTFLSGFFSITENAA